MKAMTNVNEMFQNEQKSTTGARALTGTAQLTSVAEGISADIMKKIDADFATHKDALAASKESHAAMDKLIADTYDLSAVDISFIKCLDEATIDGMLKSQQSKRSRAKGKVMTMDNYLAMMVGAIAENLIRLATGKEKSAGSSRRVGVNFTDEDLKALADDQEALRKEIRNVQSKKSIMKSKADFDEASEEWQALLNAEVALKSIRVGGTDSTKADIRALLEAVEIDQMKSADAKELLKKIAGITI
jgi:hypothetical protein